MQNERIMWDKRNVEEVVRTEDANRNKKDVVDTNMKRLTAEEAARRELNARIAEEERLANESAARKKVWTKELLQRKQEEKDRNNSSKQKKLEQNIDEIIQELDELFEATSEDNKESKTETETAKMIEKGPIQLNEDKREDDVASTTVSTRERDIASATFVRNSEDEEKEIDTAPISNYILEKDLMSSTLSNSVNEESLSTAENISQIRKQKEGDEPTDAQYPVRNTSTPKEEADNTDKKLQMTEADCQSPVTSHLNEAEDKQGMRNKRERECK